MRVCCVVRAAVWRELSQFSQQAASSPLAAQRLRLLAGRGASWAWTARPVGVPDSHGGLGDASRV